MATAREYELLFMLKAQIDSAFGTGFSKAEQRMAQLQNEQRQINAVLRDVSAYQRQMQALDTLKTKLAEEKKALEDARQSTRASQDETKRLTTAKEQHQQSIKNINAEIQKERKALDEVKAKIEAEGQETAELTAEKQKHEKAIQELNAKKKQEQEALKDVSQQLRDNKTESKNLEAEEQKRARSVDRLNEQTRKQEQKIYDTIQALKRQGVESKELEEEERRLREVLGITTDKTRENEQATRRLADAEDELKAKLEEVRQKAEEWQNTVNTITDVSNSLSAVKPAADMVANAVMRLDEQIMNCIEGAGQLQFTMAGVQAVSGATAAETQELTAAAKYMGATTIYTASECAQALQTQALAGWEVEEMLNGLPSVVQLAAASQEDLTTMTSIVSDALNAFGLSGTEAVNRFADTLAKAATSSNTTVSLLGQSLSYVETTAANLDYSIEDVSIALAVMANNALKGGVSGSALNTMLTRMSGANKTAAAEMDNLNLSMYNADGSAKDLLTYLNELRDAFRDGSMTAQEMQISAFKLAGQRGMRGLLSIVNASDEEWQKMTADIYDSKGAVDEMSNIRLDNYRGQVYLAESAFDALTTSIGEVFIPTATEVASVMTDVYTAMDGFVQKYPEVVVGFTAAANAVLLMTGGLSAAATVMAAVKTIVTVLGAETAAVFGGLLSSVLPLAALIGITAGLVAYESNLDFTSESVRKLRDETDELIATNEGALQQFDDEIERIDLEQQKALELTGVLERLTAQKQDAWSTGQIKDVVDELNQIMPSLNLEFDVSTGSLNKSMDEITGTIKGGYASDRLDQVRGKITETLREKDQYYEKFKEAAGAYREAKERLDAWERGELQDTTWSEVQSDYATAFKSMQDSYGKFSETSKELAKYKAEINMMLREEMEAKGITDISTAQYEAVSEQLATLTVHYNKAHEEAKKLIDSLYGVGKSAQEIDKSITFDSMTKSLEEQREQVRDYRKDLETIVNRAQENGVDLKNVLGNLMDGSADSIAMANRLADASVGKLKDYVKEADKLEREKEKLVDTFSLNDAVVQQDMIDLSGVIKIDDAQMAQSGIAAIETIVSSMDGAISENSERITSSIAQVGGWVEAGLTEGLGDNAASGAAANAKGENAVNEVGKGAETASPSKATRRTGQDIDRGLVAGMQDMAPAVKQKAAAVGRQAVEAFKVELSKGGAGNLKAKFSGADLFSVDNSGAGEKANGAVKGVLTGIGKTIAGERQNLYKQSNVVGTGTIQGAVDGITSKAAALAQKEAETAQKGVSSFKGAMPQSSFGAHTSGAMQSAINGINSKRGSLVAAARAAGRAASAAFKQASAGAKLGGYAAGTRSAAPGLALTGENGPELIRDNSGLVSLVGLAGPQLVPFSGGETVYNTQETQDILRATVPESQVYGGALYGAGGETVTTGAGAPMGAVKATERRSETGTVIQLTYAPVINAAGADAQSIREQLEEHDAALREQLEALLDEREAAQARRAY